MPKSTVGTCLPDSLASYFGGARFASIEQLTRHGGIFTRGGYDELKKVFLETGGCQLELQNPMHLDKVGGVYNWYNL